MRPKSSRNSRSILPLLAGLGGALLALFHIGLLVDRLAHDTPADPEVLLRWAGALALLGGAALWRQRTGRSLWSGREALVFWTLVALLHAGAPTLPIESATEVATGLVLAIAFGVFGLLRADAAAARLAGAFRHRHEPRLTPPFGPEGGPLAAPRPPPHLPSSRRF